MVNLGKTKAEKKQEKEKAAKADDPKAGADVGKIVNLMAGDANRVSNSLFFVPTSAHRIESLDLTNRIRILFPLRRYLTFPPHPPQFLLADTQPTQHHLRS
jgi:hypothetical protein